MEKKLCLKTICPRLGAFIVNDVIHLRPSDGNIGLDNDNVLKDDVCGFIIFNFTVTVFYTIFYQLSFSILTPDTIYHE